MDTLNSIITMLVMSTITPMMAEVAKGIMGAIKCVAMYFYNLIRLKDRYNVTIIARITGDTKSTQPSNFADDVQISSVMMYLNNNGTSSKNDRLSLAAPSKDASVRVNLMARQNMLCPVTQITHNGMDIKYSEDVNTKDNTTMTVRTLSISGKNKAAIYVFLDTCMKRYIDTMYPATPESRHFYMHKSDGMYADAGKLDDTETTFDDIFFPEKQLVIDLADKLSSKKLKKLSLLLHGEPGCGKTSIIRALASYLNYSIVEVKLSNIANDSNLMEILFSNLPSKVLINLDKHRCIYVFEDIDAESAIVAARKSGDSSVATPAESKSKKSATPQSTLSLAGILNALDGIRELRGVVVMTTNHIEKLDPALIRPGRVTRRIELKRMTSKCASDLIEEYFGKHDVHVDDYALTPATVGSLCQTAMNLGELKVFIKEALQATISISLSSSSDAESTCSSTSVGVAAIAPEDDAISSDNESDDEDDGSEDARLKKIEKHMHALYMGKFLNDEWITTRCSESYGWPTIQKSNATEYLENCNKYGSSYNGTYDASTVRRLTEEEIEIYTRIANEDRVAAGKLPDWSFAKSHADFEELISKLKAE